MIKQALFVAICFIINGYSALAQEKQVSKELAFAKYLAVNKQYNDAIFILKALTNNAKASSQQKDSIHYLLGSVYYQRKVLDSAIFQYGKVSLASDQLYTPAIFWKSYLENHLKLFDKGRISLLPLITTDNKFEDLKNFQLAGNSLLRRDHDQFNKRSTLFNGIYYQFAQQEKQLLELQKELIKYKYKSPALAGLMSALIPGTGKIYAGKVGQGIATIMATTIMGIQTYEGYRKDGLNSPRFIIYASLLSSFYIANVWGSVLSVNVRKREFNDTINKEILFNMHIPLRTIFN